METLSDTPVDASDSLMDSTDATSLATWTEIYNKSLFNNGDDVSGETIFNDVVGIWITGCICLLGLTGNCISFVVLQKAFGGRSPMFYVLRAMSVSDAVFLFTVFTVQTAVNIYSWTGVLQLLHDYRGYVQYVVWPLLMTTQVRRLFKYVM
jgi:hypothetical protein